MNAQEQFAKRMVERIRALVPHGVSTVDYLTNLIDEALDIQSTKPISMGVVSGVSPTKVLSSARVTAEHADSLSRICARPEGIVDLGTIEWLLRPSLPLVHGAFSQVAYGPWKVLNNNMVTDVAHGVCRINVCIAGFDAIHLGTGFVVGKDSAARSVLLTNAHVVETAQLKFGWLRVKEVVLNADFECEIERDSEVNVFIESEFRIHSEHDLALLFIPENTSTVRPILNLSKNAPEPLSEKKIGVIGHPSFDSNFDPFPRLFGFGDAFGVKRFSPGLLRAVEQRLWRFHEVDVALHDATTLSGSSGSCVFDLDSQVIYGLHFGGWPQDHKIVTINDQVSLADLFEANGAVPIWQLADDPILQSLQIAWS